MATHTIEDVQTWRGAKAVGPDGDKVGTVSEIYFDRQTGEPAWLAISTGLFGSRVSFAPIEGAGRDGEQLRLAFDKERVKDAPNVDADGELSVEEEKALYAYYGHDWGQWDETTPDHTGHDTSGPDTDDAMTRSEEELTVGTARREAGRARLRKYVVTEEVQQTIPVKREEVRIEREPITDANVDQALDGPEISSEEHEVVLEEEVPVVQKTTVPKERVRLEKDTIVEDETVSDEVRKERIEAEGDVKGR